MDTERMKRVLERVYGPVAPTEEKQAPDALRESIRLETEAAARLRDVVVEIDRDDAELPEGSMFIQDLIGLPVLCEGKTLGRVKEILQLPANDVYVVEGEQEYMIPAVPEFILERNPDEGFIRVRLLEGMQSDAV